MSSGITPNDREPTLEEILAWRAEELERQKILEQKKQLIKMVAFYLTKFSSDDSLIGLLANVISNNPSFTKKFAVAYAINQIVIDLDIEDNNVQTAVKKRLEIDALDSKSPLYNSLNEQRNWLFPFTFFGEMSYFSYNYARSLQKIHAVIKNSDEEKIELVQLS